MNKKLMIIPFTALAIAGLAGCGNKGGNDPISGKTVITVRFQYGKGMETRLLEYAAEFNALHDDIFVDCAQIQGTIDNLRKVTESDLNANNDNWPDMLSCYPDHVQSYRMNYGKATNVKNYIESDDPEIGLSDEEMADFTNAAKANLNTEFSFSGTYVLPYSSSSEAMFYNPKLLDLTIPGINNGNKITREYMNSLTWEELWDVFCPKFMEYNNTLPEGSKILKTREDGKYSIVAYDSDDNLFITMAEQYGYGYTKLDEWGNPILLFDDNEKTLHPGHETHQADMEKLLKKLNGCVSNHYLMTEGSNGSKSTDLFASENVLMEISSTGGIGYHKETFATELARIPQVAGKPMKAINQGPSWCILKHNTANAAQRQLAAWKFYKYLIEQDNILRWAAESTGYAPILKSVYATEDWAELTNEYDPSGAMKTGSELLTARTFNHLATIQDILFVNVVFNGSSSCRTYVGGLVKAILKEENISDATVHEYFQTAINNIRNDMQ